MRRMTGSWETAARALRAEKGDEIDLVELLQGLALRPKEPPSDPSAVSLLTIHSAKGLEFDHVWLIGVAETAPPIVAKSPSKCPSSGIGRRAPELFRGDNPDPPDAFARQALALDALNFARVSDVLGHDLCRADVSATFIKKSPPASSAPCEGPNPAPAPSERQPCRPNATHDLFPVVRGTSRRSRPRSLSFGLANDADGILPAVAHVTPLFADRVGLDHNAGLPRGYHFGRGYLLGLPNQPEPTAFRGVSRASRSPMNYGVSSGCSAGL